MARVTAATITSTRVAKDTDVTSCPPSCARSREARGEARVNEDRSDSAVAPRMTVREANEALAKPRDSTGGETGGPADREVKREEIGVCTQPGWDDASRGVPSKDRTCDRGESKPSCIEDWPRTLPRLAKLQAQRTPAAVRSRRTSVDRARNGHGELPDPVEAARAVREVSEGARRATSRALFRSTRSC